MVRAFDDGVFRFLRSRNALVTGPSSRRAASRHPRPYRVLTSVVTGLACVGAFVSAPAASAARVDEWTIATAGRPMPTTLMLCVLFEGVSELHPVAAHMAPPASAPGTTSTPLPTSPASSRRPAHPQPQQGVKKPAPMSLLRPDGSDWVVEEDERDESDEWDERECTHVSLSLVTDGPDRHVSRPFRPSRPAL